MRAAVIVFLLCSAPGLWAADWPRADGASWPTLHGDLQRSGCYPQFPGGTLKLVWCKNFWRELADLRAEAMVGGDLVFSGTDAGNLYAVEARTGRERWSFEARKEFGLRPSSLAVSFCLARAIVSVVGKKVLFPTGSRVICPEGN